jgi:hypothetical protein
MATPTLKLELTVAEIDMAFVLFQAAKQDKHTYEEINTLMRKIQDQGRPQLEALAVKKETPPPAPKVRKPRAPKAAPVAISQRVETPVQVDVSIPDLSDLKLD